ncbi:Ribonuclease P protein subunit p30, partial [Tetrabaena socialis]
ACTSLDVDVVVLELAQRGAVKLRPPAVKAALRRGIYFEIAYAPGLRESTARRNLFCNAQALVRATRGKNILLSSSARSASEVRSPLELLHVGALLGLTRQQAQAAISLAPRAVLAHAAARRGCGGRVVEAPAMEEGAAAAGQDVEMLDLPEADDALLGAEAAPPQQKQKQPQQQPQQPQPLRQQRASSAAAARGGARKRSAANG